jgi:hypothetical protein
MNQRQLANRWGVSEATLERWRPEGIGPVFLKLQGRVMYRLEDVVGCRHWQKFAVRFQIIAIGPRQAFSEGQMTLAHPRHQS